MAMIDPLQKCHTQKRREIFYGYARPLQQCHKEESGEKRKNGTKTKKDPTAALDPLWQCHNQFDRKIEKN